MKCSFRSTKMNLHRAASSLAGTIFSVKGKALVCSINEATHESHKLQKRVNLDASNKLSTEFLSPEWPEPTVKPSFFCGRRHFPIQPTRATDLLRDFTASLKKYVDSAIEAYEAEVVRFKSQIFSNWKFADKKKEKNRKKKKQKKLKGKGLRILEIGIGTGSNLHYYANGSDVEVIGIDPNPEMEKYARSSAASAGLPPSNFEFIQAVGENIPLSDASVDVVVGTFVLCSVKDVDLTLKEVMRVLRPGGRYMFMEHVAAKDGTFLKFIQRVLDRIERYSDGCQCHISRETGNNISKAGFSTVELNMAFLPRAFFLIPHAHGIAYK